MKDNLVFYITIITHLTTQWPAHVSPQSLLFLCIPWQCHSDHIQGTSWKNTRNQSEHQNNYSILWRGLHKSVSVFLCRVKFKPRVTECCINEDITFSTFHIIWPLWAQYFNCISDLVIEKCYCCSSLVLSRRLQSVNKRKL